MDTRERQALEREAAIAIAPHLPGWKAVETATGDWGSAYGLRDKDGRTVSVTRGEYYGERNRLRFDVDWPRDLWDFREPVPHITCASTRPPEILAREIQSRLLPRLMQAWDEAIEKRHEATRGNRELVKTALEFCQATGAEMPHVKEHDQELVLWCREKHGYAKLTLVAYPDDKGGHSVRVSFERMGSLSATAARKILDAMATEES